MPRFLVMALLTGWLALPAFAVQPAEMLADPELEARARAISADLRCLVCQNQSIDDSDAPLARDLRVLVRERLLAGDGNEEAVAYIVERYGDYVLLKPPFNAATMLLWVAPFAVPVIVWMVMRRRVGEPASAEVNLTPEEKARLQELTRDRPS